MEHLPDRRGRDLGQAVLGRSERLLQGAQRPGRRAVGLGRGLSPDLAEDALASGLIVDPRLPTAVARREGLQAFDIESGDQVRDSVAGASACGVSGLLIVAAARDGQKHGGSGDLDGGCDLGPTELGEGLALGVGGRPERILLAA